jgi:hypothetical protein
MIESISHFIGICPDNIGHFDILDFIGYNWSYFYELFKLKFGNLKYFFYIY